MDGMVSYLIFVILKIQFIILYELINFVTNCILHFVTCKFLTSVANGEK